MERIFSLAISGSPMEVARDHQIMLIILECHWEINRQDLSFAAWYRDFEMFWQKCQISNYAGVIKSIYHCPNLETMFGQFYNFFPSNMSFSTWNQFCDTIVITHYTNSWN